MINRLARLFVVVLLAVVSAIAVLPTQKAAAAQLTPSGYIATWVDGARIDVTTPTGQTVIITDKELDDDYRFTNGECGSKIGIDGNAQSGDRNRWGGVLNNPGSFTKGFLLLKTQGNQQVGACVVRYGEEVEGDDFGVYYSGIAKPERRAINYYPEGDNLAQADGDNDWAFAKCSDSTIPNCDKKWFRMSETSCRDVIEITSTVSIDGKTYSKGTRQEYKGSSNCSTTGTPLTVVLAQEAAPPGSPSTGSTNPAGGANANAKDGLLCETEGGNPLTWVLCPVFNGIADLSDWLFQSFVQPFLYTSPISTDSNDPSFQIWSNFRIYGNIILIVALLIIVFGQVVGGGVIDAYTAKKIVPRILIAAILINLSIYLIDIMVDLTNILGNGIGNLLLAPLRTSGQLTFTPNGAEVAGVFTAGFLGVILGGAGIAGIAGGLVFGGAFAGKAALFLLFVVIVPALLAILGVFVTLVLRRGLILMLLLVSPVAFALYCLPNTEKYFKKWWDLLFKSLMVYPIVIAIFAIADIMAVGLLNANGIRADADLGDKIINGGIASPLAAIIAFVLQFLPLFLIPFSFKFAGGAIGSLYGAITGGIGKAGGMLKGRQEQSRKDMHRQMIQSRLRTYGNLGSRADAIRRGPLQGLRKGTYRFMQDRTGGYDLMAEHARLTDEQNKLADATKDTGIDDELRALTVNKDWALANDATGGTHWQWETDRAGNRTGRRQFKTLGGRWVSENNVDLAHSRWDGNEAQLQWSLAYEMQKATTQEQMDYLHQNYGRLNQAGSGFAMNEGAFGGIWTGASFMKQNTDREWKHYYWNADTQSLEANGLGMMQEIDERQGSWQMAAQHADTWNTMSEEVNRARRVISSGVADGQMDVAAAQEVMQRGARVAKSLTGGYTDAQGVYHESIGQGASGATREAMENYSALFDWYQRDPAGNVLRGPVPAGSPPGTLGPPLRLEDGPAEYDRNIGTARRNATDPATGRPVRPGGPTPGGDTLGGPPIRPAR